MLDVKPDLVGVFEHRPLPFCTSARGVGLIRWYFSTVVSISTTETKSHDFPVFRGDLLWGARQEDVGEPELSLQLSLWLLLLL